MIINTLWRGCDQHSQGQPRRTGRDGGRQPYEWTTSWPGSGSWASLNTTANCEFAVHSSTYCCKSSSQHSAGSLRWERSSQKPLTAVRELDCAGNPVIGSSVHRVIGGNTQCLGVVRALLIPNDLLKQSTERARVLSRNPRDPLRHGNCDLKRPYRWWLWFDWFPL